MDTIKKGFILEQKDNRQIVRTVVKDIITIFKKENEGEFYLPEELEEDTLEYEFPKFSFLGFASSSTHNRTTFRTYSFDTFFAHCFIFFRCLCFCLHLFSSSSFKGNR